MKSVEFCDGDVQIDASLIAEGLGLALPIFRQQMPAGSPACPSAGLTRISAGIA
jgi:hypothetical protein